MQRRSSKFRSADLPLPVKAPIYAPPPLLSWEGSYVGILGGVANHRANLDPNCTTNIGCETTELTRTGGTIGALLGHNWQQGNFVYGLEGDWTWLGGIKTSTGNTEILQSFDVRWVGTLRGRAGLAFDATLVYLTGGLAFGRVDNSFIAYSTTEDCPAHSSTIKQDSDGRQVSVSNTCSTRIGPCAASGAMSI